MPDFTNDERALLLGLILNYENLKPEATTTLARELNLEPTELHTQLQTLRQKLT